MAWSNKHLYLILIIGFYFIEASQGKFCRRLLTGWQLMNVAYSKTSVC